MHLLKILLVIFLSAVLLPLSAMADVYVVEKGDTLYSIALKNNTTVGALQNKNNLKDTTIFPGQKLNISVVSTTYHSSLKTDRVSRGISFSGVRTVLGKAVSLLGSRYAYGAGGPRAFDCSGFTSYVYKSLGFNLPHNAAAQAAVGKPVSKAGLLPGDLVFFSYYGNRGINHVGIYCGDNKFIHASSSSRGVIYSSLRDAYYQNNYRGARRILYK
ncbi:MAG TPA: peptidoglycan endopeptidase [Desulfotomaculum sp.]|nr:peptidoglycan endopeptidase [Desulfotomaculum sp.]